MREQCRRRKRIGKKRHERCLRAAGHAGFHVFASSPPITTFLRLIELIERAPVPESDHGSGNEGGQP